MKILIVGAGAVGGYYGGRLAAAGNQVKFIARGGRLAVLKKMGLRVESVNGDFSIMVNVSDRSDQVFDLVLISVKTYHLDEAVRLIEKNISSATTVISLLNGVESENTLVNSFGPKSVVGGIAFIGSALKEDGVILHSASGSLTIGELSGEKSQRCDEIQKAFLSSGVHCKVSDSIQTDIWGKMIWNVGFNAVTAITGAYVSDVLKFSESERLVTGAMEEARCVARSENILLPEDIVSKTVEKTRKAGAIKTSMLQDMERGTRTEVDSINGAIVRLGDKHGVPVPVNRTLLRLLSLKSCLAESFLTLFSKERD